MPEKQDIVDIIWPIAEILRHDYKRSDYGKVVLPMTVLRRLDCVLEPTKSAVLKKVPEARQAIEENFILDVLQNYTTYKTFFKLTKRIEEDPRFDKKQARRAIARFIDLHPHNLAQKVEIIIEHFKSSVMHKIGGQAKAMVVTSSRLHAVRYKYEVDKYLREKRQLGDRTYDRIKALVAFSGTVKDDFGIEHTEAQMNGFGESELPERFAGEEYQILLVADKYQTGFDQPLLHTMYVDKKLSGVRAVQTLSRLNRVYPGKEDTFILDFVNEAQEIQEAFQDFYEGTTIEEDIDPNQLYTLKNDIERFPVLRNDEINSFAQIFFQSRSSQLSRQHALLNRAIDPAVDRFRLLAEEEQGDFKHLLASFVRLYSYLSQVMPFVDIELEKLYAYARLLMTKIRDEGSAARIQFNDEIALEYYRIQKMSEGPIILQKNIDGELRVATDVGTGDDKTEEASLSTIIEVLNERFGTDFNKGDQIFFEQIEHELFSDPTLAQQGKANTLENFRYPFNDMFINKVVERMEQNQEIAEKIISEESFAEAVAELIMQNVYKRFHDVS
jgi:type I restriction enzyme R subunit